jgi:hypothetical protein
MKVRCITTGLGPLFYKFHEYDIHFHMDCIHTTTSKGDEHFRLLDDTVDTRWFFDHFVFVCE